MFVMLKCFAFTLIRLTSKASGYLLKLALLFIYTFRTSCLSYPKMLCPRSLTLCTKFIVVIDAVIKKTLLTSELSFFIRKYADYKRRFKERQNHIVHMLYDMHRAPFEDLGSLFDILFRFFNLARFLVDFIFQIFT